jgi:uncharacterized membrane protein YgdD (TMEM256/DUF423 family)
MIIFLWLHPIEYIKTVLLVAHLSAAVGMMTSAFGSHGLKKRQGITNEGISAFQTAANHAVTSLNTFCGSHIQPNN